MSPSTSAHAGPLEVARIAGVREQVEGDDVVVGVLLEPPADEVRADEAGGAGDEQAAQTPIDPAPRGSGSLVLQRCFTRGSSHGTPFSSGLAASYSSVTRYMKVASVSAS